VEELQDLYQAENQLVKAIPKMTEAAHDPQPTHGLDQHLEQTKEHARRLEQAFKILGYETKARTCKGIKGIVEEGVWEIKHGRYKPTFAADLAPITAAQKVERYEISGYGSVRTMAEQIGKQDLAAFFSSDRR
jgi:ferritin-like metal-binding protein YciE